MISELTELKMVILQLLKLYEFMVYFASRIVLRYSLN